MGDVAHSKFQFDFDFERKVLAEAEKENPNWSRFALENVPSRTSEPMPSVVNFILVLFRTLWACAHPCLL